MVDEFTQSSSRGTVQQLQKEASSFCGMVAVFCRRLNWCHLAAIIQSYSQRLCFGVKDELLPIVKISPEVRYKWFDVYYVSSCYPSSVLEFCTPITLIFSQVRVLLTLIFIMFIVLGLRIVCAMLSSCIHSNLFKL